MTEDSKVVLSGDLEKALLDIFDGDVNEVNSLLKAKKADDDDMEEETEAPEQSEEDEGEDMEKAYNKMKSELNSMKKSFDEKQKAFEEMGAKMKSKKSEETAPVKVEKSEENDIEKADKADLIKSLSDTISETFESRFGEIEKANQDELDELRKSITDSFNEIKKSLEVIGGTPMGRRSAVKESDVLTKAEDVVTEQNQKSISDRKFIEKALDNLIEKSDSGIKIKYQNELMNLNAGGVIPSQSTLNDISKAENITFTK